MSIGKIVLSVAAMVIGLTIGLAFNVQPSMAQQYPFCRSSEAGPGDCRYETLSQCQSAISGLPGFCQPNYFLPPAAAATQPRRARRS